VILSLGAEMRRRDFIKAVTVSAVTWPFAAGAQQTAMPVIGFLYAGSANTGMKFVAGFLNGLSEIGYREGQNVAFEYRWAEGRYDRLPALASELLARKVNVVIASGGTVAARAAKAATSTIPIVFVGGGDPVKDGLINSLNHPGGNITGVNQFSTELIVMRLELRREVVPRVAAIGLLTNPTNPNTEPEEKALQDAAAALGCMLHIASATTEAEIEPALEGIIAQGAGALMVGTAPLWLAPTRFL
jgi:putative tryptophan/tyrosine transport system substrate-binding protein